MVHDVRRAECQCVALRLDLHPRNMTAYVVGEFGELDEKSGALQADKKVCVEDRIVWDVMATEIE